MIENFKTALIVGAGDGLSASLARQLSAAGLAVALAARDTGKLAKLLHETGAKAFTCDASRPADVVRLFEDVETRLGAPGVVIYNVAAYIHGPIVEIDPSDVERSLANSAFGAFLVGQQAARVMVPGNSGVILFTGATASVKGYAQSAPFAMGKFAVRALAQSMARELGPQGIHVAHVLIDGSIRNARRPEPADKPDSHLDPDAIAAAYLHLIAQPRTAWTQELDVRPWCERF